MKPPAEMELCDVHFGWGVGGYEISLLWGADGRKPPEYQLSIRVKYRQSIATIAKELRQLADAMDRSLA